MIGLLRNYAGICLVAWIMCSSGCNAQQPDYNQDYGEYQDYGNDYGQQESGNLYNDYMERQEAKNEAAAVGGAGGYVSLNTASCCCPHFFPCAHLPIHSFFDDSCSGMGKVLMASAVCWLCGGRFHSGRALKKAKAKFQKEQKALYSQYYNDVYKLTEQNSELAYAVEQLQTALKDTKEKAELEALQRDYEEFKQPDIDGDDRISRAEFNMYVKNYLSNYPGLAEKDYPKFEDFDHDGDGYVSFQEYAQQMALQVQQAELEQYYAQQSGGSGTSKNAKKAQGLKELYGETKKADSFQDLYAAYSK
eukprot:CAMPEP_0116829544 /NCGR_PEP_ID=MMETSP0418-20121206/4273_1 /TAXON_ID=1158023 /ORGANISM="Astrosyne radiata, Strain 13vi08-1A" /LENGTH=304 /DNA_ID=CAMNT_0004458561 /DNA_START=808 /DNA_END=1722 /DNA_ORIENTATION=-